ncbi:unnamed protein product [Parnassius apollo]|uniref:(apollo) hypothetical protein n=1 Tax=Parnassius apollo TaxID=110799 RepID=A0A8S3X4E7_PARAO|nr:unnamed protein product [Parnassius apollo]
MWTYKRKTERRKISKEVYEKAAAILEEDKTKKIRGIAKDLGLCHMSLTRYLKKRKEAKEKGTPIESLTVGYQKNRQVFNDEQERILEDDFLSAFVTDRPIDETANSNLENTPVITEITPINFPGTLSPTPPHSSKDNTIPPIPGFIEEATEVVDAAEECESSLYGSVAGCSRDLFHNECTTFSPDTIRPYPKAAARTNKVTRKTRKSAILTDTPEKNVLAQEQSKKKEITSKNRKVTKKGKSTEPGKMKREKTPKETRKIAVKRKVLHDSESDEGSVDDYFCLICCEPFDQSRAGEEWVQCVVCKKWSHVRCAKGNVISYICLNCESDCSD